jgi:putative flippase GtrA
MAELRNLIAVLSRYGAAGLVNTAFGYATIEALYRGLGAPPALANAAGFAVGTTTGFVLSRGFVFRSDAPRRETAPRYLLTAAMGFALNQAVLALMLGLLGRAGLGHEIAQLCAMASYTVFVFVTCRLWVFRKATAVAEA